MHNSYLRSQVRVMHPHLQTKEAAAFLRIRTLSKPVLAVQRFSRIQQPTPTQNQDSVTRY